MDAGASLASTVLGFFPVKTLFLVILSVLGLVLAGVLIVPGAVDWNRFKAPIAEGLRAFSGREVALEGDVRFSVLPVPTLSVAGVRIGNPAGAQEPDLLRLARLDARVSLLPLLAGRIEVEHIVLEHPELTLETLPDGRRGWLPASGSAEAPLPRATRLDRIELHDGALVWRDDAGGSLRRIDGLHARISAASLAGPFELVGRGETAGLPLTFEAATGVIGEGASTPIRLSLATLDGAAALRFAGLVADGGEPRLQGDLKAEVSGSLAPVAAALGLTAPLPDRPFTLHAALDAQRKAVSLTGMEILSGDATLTGNTRLTLTPGQPPALDLKLAAGRLDFRSWPAPSVLPDLAALRLPVVVTAGLDLSVDALGLGRGELRQAVLRARLAQGVLTLDRLGALGPGGSELTVSGMVAPAADGVPAADLRIEAGTDNLRMLLERLEVDSSGVAGDRLRRASLAARLRGRPGDLRLSAIDLRLDTSRLTGQAGYRDPGYRDPGYRDQGRPQVSARLEVDHLDLDAYRAGPPPESRSLAAVLAGLDLDLALRLGALTSGGLALHGLELDAAADHGALTLRSLRIADVAGLALGLQGRVAGLEPARGLDLSFSAETASLATAERAFALALPPPLRRLGALRLGGHLAGDDARLSLALTVDSEAGASALSGELAREDGKWRLSGLQGTLAGTPLKGEAVLGLAGRRPMLDLRLAAGELALDRLWPDAPRAALRRWSVDRLDFAWLGGFDARLRLDAAALSLGGRRLTAAGLAADLDDGTLTLERLEGETMGGRFSARGRLTRTAAGAGEAELSLTVSGARFERGLFDDRLAAATVDVASGTLDLDVSLTCSGDSELALVGSLAGTGRFTVVGGRLRGVDLPALNRRIAALRQPADVAAGLAPAAGFAGDDTPFDRLESGFEIDHGLVATSGLRLTAASGAGEGEGMVDLPNRLLNLALHLRPDHHPPLPPLGVLVTGSLDRPQQTLDTGELQDHVRRELLAAPPP